MIQLRRNDPSRRRRIKRDLSSIPKKGVAGIKFLSQLTAVQQLDTSEPPSTSSSPDQSSIVHSTTNDPEHTQISRLTRTNSNGLCPPTPIAPSNTPQTPHTPSTASSSSSSPDTSEVHNIIHQSYYPTSNSCGHSFCTYCRGNHGNNHSHPVRSNHNVPNSAHVSFSSSANNQPNGSSSNNTRCLDDTMRRLNRLSLSSGFLEFYPLENVDETEQYHLSSDEEDQR